MVGTQGCVDPKYCSTLEYNKKSDVFSFEVVLQELIMGQPPILKGVPDEMVFIVERVQEKLKRGNIEAIIDSRLQNIYDINSIWPTAELELLCTADVPSERPTMSEIIAELKESLR
ncbi:senescence-induced receptor-like serine/threonine-protein kinase [Zingiber officinale]|nr:senescence-induced receptor-like serine/threonine-protein kinase [Zingiber officinale]